MSHIGDTNKMVDTPRTDAGLEYDDTTVDGVKEFARRLEGELNAANGEIERLKKSNLQLREGAEEQKQRIHSLIAERDTAQTYADQKWKLRREFHDLFGTDDVEQAVAVVRDMNDRIKRLEEAGDALANTQTYDLLETVNWRKSKEAKP